MLLALYMHIVVTIYIEVLKHAPILIFKILLFYFTISLFNDHNFVEVIQYLIHSKELLLSQAVLLQEGAVGMLLQIHLLDAMSSAPVGRLGWLVCSFRAVSLLCDTTVSFSPTESFLR